MIRLVYSNRTEELLEALARSLDEERARPGWRPLRPTHLVVPNRNVGSWVRLGLARRAGIAANLETHFLKRFLVEVAGGLDRRVRLLDGDDLAALLLGELHDEALLAEPDLAPVAAWLRAAGDAPDAVDRRRVELAAELGRLLEEYGYSRPAMLAAWAAGRATLDGTPHAATERWQRRLHERLFGAGGVVEERARASGLAFTTLAGLLDRRSPLLADRAVALPPRLHVFGFSYVARAFHQLFAALAGRTELHVYALNPCEELWEDVPTEGEHRRRLPRVAGDVDGPDPFGLGLDATDPGPPALRLWGRPGRENIRLLNELSDCDFEPRFRDPLTDGPTLLRQLQHDILVRASGPAGGERRGADGSLVVVAAPGVRRELEIVAGEIWRLVEESGDGPDRLRFNDVAVLLSRRDQQAYLPHLASVFREAHELPHHVVDLTLEGESRVVEAIGLLLDLPLGGCTRRELGGLVTHPSVAGRWRDVDPADWLALIDRLGVVHGADHEGHAGTYIARDVLNWDQGMRRLALGAFLAGEASGVDDTLALDGERYVPEERAQSELPSAARLALLVRSLLADARALAAARLPLARWAALLRELVATYVVAGSTDEERDLDRCLRALDELGELPFGDRAVSYRVAHDLARERLGGLGSSRGHYLADGVVVSSLLPMRAIPFRVVFVLGLGEGRFPAADRKSQLDLRLAERRAGDVTAREQDKYMFLETLLACRERLYLSYVARDPLTGEARAPSSVVQELLQLVVPTWLDADAREKLVVHHPLRRHHPAPDSPRDGGGDGGGARRPALPGAWREAQAEALGVELRAALAEGASTDGTPPPLAGMRELRAAIDSLRPDLAARLRDQLGLLPPPPLAADAPTPGGRALQVSLSSLRRFLECPLQGFARFWLHLDEIDEDPLATEDEPFDTELPREVGLLRQVFVEALAAGADPLARYEAHAERGELTGELPTGVFGEAQRERHLDALSAWLRGVGPDRPITLVRLGGAPEHAPHGPSLRVREPLPLDVDVPGLAAPLRVSLVGTTEALVDGGAGSLLPMLRKRTGERSRAGSLRDHKSELRALFDHALLSALGERDGEPHRAHLLYDDGEPRVVTFRPFAPGAARAWLAALVADLVGSAHEYLLPCEAVFDWHARGGSLEDRVAEVSKKKFHSSLYGPVGRPTRFPPPDEAEGAAIIARRFGPLFELRESDAGAAPASSAGDEDDR